MRLITKFESWSLSEYLIETCWTECESLRLNKLAMSNKILLWIEWNRYDKSQSLSLILKSLAMTRTLWRLALVSLRYFKAEWGLSE